MLTDRKPGKLARELLGFAGIAGAISLVVFLLLSTIAGAVVEEYAFNRDIPMTEFDWLSVDQRIFTVSAILSCIAFSVLFLGSLSSRIAYIRTITEGIGQLRDGQKQLKLPLQGNNELKQLAEAINAMSEAQLALREKEQALAREKEQLIRTLSHDIRTPLTSILSLSELLSTREEMTPEEQKAYLDLVRKKAGQIRDMTDILLDGGRRNMEEFEDARLLMEQLAAEFEETLEEQFVVRLNLSASDPFRGSFDVQELRRIFDNLSSNVQKYADPTQPVQLAVSVGNGCLVIRQSNGSLSPKPRSESFQIGLNSIRRIVQHYAGQVHIEENTENFAITISIPV